MRILLRLILIVSFWFLSACGVNYYKTQQNLEKSCPLNDAASCFNLGILYANGEGVKQDYKQAKVYYKKACDLDNSEGCKNIGVLYYNG